MAGIDDRILSRRQRDLDRFTESMADSLDRQAGQFGQQLLPAWAPIFVYVSDIQRFILL
jgi:hypothetical protein